MAPHVDYVAHADWMWYDDGWIPKRIAFAPTYEADQSDPYVVRVKPASLNKFSYADVVKNLNVYPLEGFPVEDETFTKLFEVTLDELDDYVANGFYKQVLKDVHSGWDVTIGTFDWATFMYLEPLLPGQTVYLGDQRLAESCAKEKAQQLQLNCKQTWDKV